MTDLNTQYSNYFKSLDIDLSAYGLKIENVETSGVDKVGGGVTVTFTSDKGGSYTLTIPTLDAPDSVDDVQLQELQEKLEALAKEAQILASSSSSGTQELFFDIYSAMALMLKTAQALRKTTRAARENDLESTKKAIEAQAKKQKSAAVAGLVMGLVNCAISIGMMMYAMKGQAQNANSQRSISADAGIGGADGSYAQMKQALGALKADQKSIATLETQMNEVKGVLGDQKVQDIDMNMSSNENYIQDVKSEITQAKSNIETLKGEISQLKAQGGNDIQQQITNKEAQIAAAERTIAEKEPIVKYAETKQELENLKAGLGDKQAAVRSSLKKFQEDCNVMNQREDYIDTKHKEVFLNSLQTLTNTFYGVLSAAANSTSGTISADATAQEKVTKEKQELLEKDKEMFAQTTELLNTLLQTVQAIARAESEANQTIINA